VYYYCYICKRARRQQELMIISSGHTTALDHLVDDHQMNQYTGFLEPPKPSDPNQPKIEDYPEQRA
jgi:hypothetical protein